MLDKHWFSEIYPAHGAAFSLKIQQVLHEEKTPYQHIQILETETFGRLMVIDGCVMLTDRDNFFYHEMMSHLALFTHPAPEQVLIIGGGDCGTLREVLQHGSVKQVAQVEIDERVTRLAEQFFPALCSANQDARVKFHFLDAIQWVAECPPASYDVIIVDSTDPVGPAEGLFNAAFYRACLTALKTPGILVQQSESPLLHQALIQSMHQAMRAVGFNETALATFPQCVYPSGWWSATLAGKQLNLKDFRQEAVQSRAFQTHYYNAEIHRAAFALPEFMRAVLDVSPVG